MAQFRRVPEDRIKTLTACEAYPVDLPECSEGVPQRIAESMGRELARKLAEHGKLKFSKSTEGNQIIVWASIDVIVPK